MCGVAAGALYCWGFNLGGQIGDGTTTERRTPTLVNGGLSIAILPPDCMVATDNKGYCMTGAGPVGVPLAGGWASLQAGDQFDCGMGLDGFAYCWGQNPNGRLGIGSTDPSITLAAPTRIAGQY
jgi:hypothetical protein